MAAPRRIIPEAVGRRIRELSSSHGSRGISDIIATEFGPQHKYSHTHIAAYLKGRIPTSTVATPHVAAWQMPIQANPAVQASELGVRTDTAPSVSPLPPPVNSPPTSPQEPSLPTNNPGQTPNGQTPNGPTPNGPTRDEIISLIREGRGMAYVWNTLKERYGPPHGTYGRLVYDTIQDNAASNNSPVTAPENTNSPTTEHHDAIVLSNPDSPSATGADNPPIMQPAYNITVINPPPLPPNVAMVPYATRLKDWKLRVRKGWEAGIPFDPAQLADNLGYYDIAYHWRTGALTWDIFRQQDEDTSRRPEDFYKSLEEMMRMGIGMQFIAPITQMASKMLGATGQTGTKDPRIEELLKKMDEQSNTAFQESMKAEINNLKEAIKESKPNEDDSMRTQLLEFQVKQMKKQLEEKNKNEQFQTYAKMVEAASGSRKDMTEKLQAMQLEFSAKMEAHRRVREAAMETMRKEERDSYKERLQSLETKLDNATKGQTGNPIEFYRVFRGVVKSELKDLDNLRQSGGANIPELLSNVAKEFVPVLGKGMPQQASPVQLPPAVYDSPVVNGQVVRPA